MKKIAAFLMILTVTVFACGSERREIPQTAGTGRNEPLRLGDRAPGFEVMRTTDNRRVALQSILKAGPVLLAFYPAAFSPG